MHASHKLVKVQACLTRDGDSCVKRIHQKTLATPDPTPQIHTARYFRTFNQAFKRTGSIPFEGDPVVKVFLQALNRRALRVVWLITAFSQTALIVLKDVQKSFRS
jgi:hypothetical protein